MMEVQPRQRQGQGSQQGFNCPICQKLVTISVDGIKDLPQDLHLEVEVKMAQYQSKIASNSEVVLWDVCIDSTSSGPAVGFCCSCLHFLCQQCCDHHKRARNLYQHDVVALGETVSREQLSAVKPTCALHSKEFIFYCKVCNCLICYDCTTNDHKDHLQSIALPSVAANSRRDDIRTLITSAEESASKLAVAINGKITALKAVEDNEENVCQRIEQSFLQLHQALDDRRKTLLADVHSSALSKKTALTLQKEKCEKNLSCCIDVASTVLETYTDCEIISLKQLVSAELRTYNHKAQSWSSSLEPCVCSDIVKVSLQTDKYKAYLSEIGHLIDYCPEKSTWSSTSSSPMECYPYILTVEAKDSNGQIYPYDDIKLKVVLKPLNDTRSDVLGKISQHRNGKYSISLTPVCSGPHQLSITMNGQHVQNSPSSLRIEEAI